MLFADELLRESRRVDVGLLQLSGDAMLNVHPGFACLGVALHHACRAHVRAQMSSLITSNVAAKCIFKNRWTKDRVKIFLNYNIQLQLRLCALFHPILSALLLSTLHCRSFGDMRVNRSTEHLPHSPMHPPSMALKCQFTAILKPALLQFRFLDRVPFAGFLLGVPIHCVHIHCAVHHRHPRLYDVGAQQTR